MSVSVQSIYDQVCYDLLEDSVSGPGMILGITTQQEVLDYLGQIVMDFLRQTGIIQGIFTQKVQAGVSQYLIPNTMAWTYYGFIDAKIIERVDLFSDYLLGNWTRKPGYPKAWHQDGLPIKTAEVVPAPNWNGADPVPTPNIPPFGNYGSFNPGDRNFTLIGSLISPNETWTIGQTLDTIPDTFTPYLSFGILSRIFSMDGEAKDNQRALYCQSRYEEGVILAKAILWELMEDAEND